MDYIIKINNLYYKDVLNNINLELSNKSFNILIGRNSSGKTTLLKSIMGLNECSGSIFIDISKNEISTVSSENELLEGTVLYNLKYPMENLGKKNTNKIISDLLKEYDCSYLLYKDISELTKSEYKIVQILVALIITPKLIIIDDTLDDIKPIIKMKLLKKIKELSKSVCVIWFTSNADYLEFADKIFLLNNGYIEDSFIFDEIFAKEKIFNKLNIKLPFKTELSNKLKFYELIKSNLNDIDEMVNEVWE